MFGKMVYLNTLHKCLARARRASGQDWQADATGKSQTRIRPGLAANTYRQEPDANQARILRSERPARARRASGQDWQAGATGKSQTRIRPGFEAGSQEQECSGRGRSGNGGGTRERARALCLEKTIPDTQGSGKTNANQARIQSQEPPARAKPLPKATSKT